MDLDQGPASEMMLLTTGRLAEPQEIADAVGLPVSRRAASTTGTRSWWTRR